jgi:hypothetical protein
MKEDCCIEDAHAIHREKAYGCEEIEDPEEREVCYAEVKESLEQAIEDCLPEPPTCGEKADQFYSDGMKECETITVEPQRQECFDDANEKFLAMNEQCCIEDAHSVHKEKAERCEEIDDAVERENCLAQVEESLKKNLEECSPEPTCWEEAMNWLNEHLETCNAIEDPEEMQQCHSKGHAKYEKWTAECRIEECYEAMEAKMEPEFEGCKTLDTVAQQEACLEEAEAILKQLKEDNCHEQPNCWENAASVHQENIARCDALDDMSADK